MILNDKDLDALIDSVSKELDSAQALSKSSLKKDEGDKPEDERPGEDAPMAPEAPAAPEAAAAPEMPPQDAGAQPPAEGGPGDELPPDGSSPEAPAEEPGPGPEGEPEAQMSPEDYMQIAASMDGEELEMWASIVQQELQRRHGQENQPMPQQQAEAPSEMPLAASEKANDDLRKSEQEATIDELKKEQGELKKSIELLTRAIETGFKPVRKSIQSEFDIVGRGDGMENTKPLSDQEIKAKLKEVTKSTSLSKSDRQAINDFCLYGKGREAVEKLVIGGK